MNRERGGDTTRAKPCPLRLIGLLALAAGGMLSPPTGGTGTATQQGTGEYVDDAAGTMKVMTALVRDPVVEALQVDATTRTWCLLEARCPHRASI